MASDKELKIYFVVGEESGDLLGSRLIDTLNDMGTKLTPMGLGGERMRERGVQSLFDVSDISVMGISGVLAQLPKLLKRINQTASDIIDKKPDLVLLIDSPEFSYRVAQKVRSKLPSVKIIKYVAPSVWAWRPGRAKKIKPYIDHVLTVLPFEPELLESLGGPSATYVGHPLAAEMPDIDDKKRKKTSKLPNLVILPGSRRSEIKRLLPFLKETLAILKERGNEFNVTLPSVLKLESEIRTSVKTWSYRVRVVTGDEARKEAFTNADLALAASGTVTLELALFKVPMISIYKLDGIAMQIRHLLTGWTASLPNLIADYPVVPERFNEYAHPQYVARMVERLAQNGHERQLQLEGFSVIREKLAQDSPSHEVAARTILGLVKK